MALILLVSKHLPVFWTRDWINAMRHQNSVFHGLLKHVPWSCFDNLVGEHKGDAGVRRLTTKSQFVALLYGQLSGASSLREIETAMHSHAARLYHVGACDVQRSTLADANASRPHAIFSGLFAKMVLIGSRGLRQATADAVRLIDSTGVRLSGIASDWARFSKAASGAKAQRFISVQAEAAWGRMLTKGGYVGIAQDLADFPFIRALGVSSYPYFGHSDPDEIPADYYTRLRGKTGLPVIVTEGGWVSKSFGPIKSTPDKQTRYIIRHGDLLDSVDAIGWFQLQFAELDLKSFPGPLPDILPLFTSIALAESNFRAKPALAQWDAQFARRWVG